MMTFCWREVRKIFDVEFKLTRYADVRPGGHCDIPVNLILDEFNNIRRIGGAAAGSDFARTEMLCIIRGCNILKLNKLDYTKHPMAQEMTGTSIMDYQPQASPAAFP